VIAAAATLEAGQPEDALTLIEPAIAADDCPPVDHVWLMVQAARAYTEIGRFDAAIRAAETIQTIRLTHAHDVTATAIAGTAAVLLYILAGLGTGDTEAAVSGMDTTAVWWRFLHVADGATAAIEREFTTWTQRTIIMLLRGTDEANNELFVASTLASHLGDHGGWRSWECLNIQQAFLEIGRASPPDRVSDLLNRLRLAGDEKALGRAVGRLVADGPSAAVTAAAAQIDFTDLTGWTGTTSHTNLALLERSGDVLDATTATAAVAWLLATLTDPDEFLTRTSPTYWVGHQLISTLAGVVPSAPANDQRAVAEFVVGLPAQTDQAIATDWARVVHALPVTIWIGALADAAIGACDAHHVVLRQALLGVVAASSGQARQQLLAEIQEGSLEAFVALNDARAVSTDVARQLIDQLVPLVQGHIDRARHGAFGGGGLDAGRTLTILNAVHPDVAQWEPIYALLDEPAVAASHKMTPCDVLATWTKELPTAVRDRMRTIVTSMIDNPTSLADPFHGQPDALGPAAWLAAALATDGSTNEKLLIRLLAGDDDHRKYAARVAMAGLEPEIAVGVLNPLIQDRKADVRAAAAAAVAHLILEGTESPLAISTIRKAIADPGTQVPLSVARTLRWRQERPAVATKLLSELAAHPAASVRRAALPPDVVF
jgi:hypothetical protein